MGVLGVLEALPGAVAVGGAAELAGAVFTVGEYCGGSAGC